LGADREVSLNAVLDAAFHVRPYPGFPLGGDLGVIRPLHDGALVALVDAVGHGLTAYSAAQIARQALMTTGSEAPEAVLGELDVALQGSVGAVAAVARIFRDRVAFAGIGNVAAWCAGQRLLSRDGVLGQRFRTPRVSEHALPHGQWFLLASDGISSTKPLVPAGTAATAARALVESAGKGHDDAAVLVARWVEGTP
jgi:hypothetical protein